MGRTAGILNKVKAEVRSRLECLIIELINTIRIEVLNYSQKI